MLKTRRRLMTVKLLALSALGLAAIVALVAVGFWHRRQLDAEMEGAARRHRRRDWTSDTSHGERWRKNRPPLAAVGWDIPTDQADRALTRIGWCRTGPGTRTGSALAPHRSAALPAKARPVTANPRDNPLSNRTRQRI